MEWKCTKCCYVFQITGAFDNRKNQIYFQNGTLINNYPLFLSFDQKSIVWFNNQNWIVGNNETPSIDADIKSANMSNCPADSKEWIESVNGNPTLNTNFNLECFGKCLGIICFIRIIPTKVENMYSFYVFYRINRLYFIFIKFSTKLEISTK